MDLFFTLYRQKTKIIEFLTKKITKMKNLKINDVKKAVKEVNEEFGFEIDVKQNKEDLLEQLAEIWALTGEDVPEDDAVSIAEINALSKPTLAILRAIKPEDEEEEEEAEDEEEVEEEEQEEEVEEKPKKKVGKKSTKEPVKKGTAKPKEKKKIPTKQSGKNGMGIIQTIVNCVEKAGKKGISKEAILEVLEENFPEKDPKSMKQTINVQVPYRINKERFEVVKMENGNFRKK